MRLLIISHTPHYQGDDAVVGWGPTIREIDQLATLFDEVVHLAPLYQENGPKSALPYTAENVRYTSVKPAGGDRLLDKLQIMQRIPGWLAAMKKEIQQADYVHIRCPAGISLVALLAARWWAKGKPTWVKYAGNWEANRENISYSLQRFWLNMNFHNGVVTINGRWPDQPLHIITFTNPSYSLKEYHSASQIANNKSIREPIKLLFVGRLETAKGAGRVIEIAKLLRNAGLIFSLTLIGDGPEKSQLENLILFAGLQKNVIFTGWQAKQTINQYYKNAHFILHPSTASEGWPKVLSEAMAYGVVPLASTVSSIPMILEDTKAGLAIPSKELQAYADAILRYTKDIDAWKRASMNGIAAGKRFTYEHYLADIKIMFKQCFHIELTHV